MIRTIAILLAAAGLIGLTSYVAGRRNREPKPQPSAVVMRAEPPRIEPVAHEAILADPPAPAWKVLESAEWAVYLPGSWVGTEHGDAIQGGKLVTGGARVKFEHKRKDSRTPWNVSWVVPRKGDDSTTAGGGCGFYETGTAFCKGYGLPEGETPRKTVMLIEINGSAIRLSVSGVLGAVELVREPVK